MIKEVIKMLTPTDGEYKQIGRQLTCLKKSDIASELSHVETPALIIAGERDVLVPIEHARKLAAKLRGSRLVSIPGAGHSPFVEATDAVIGAMNEFL
jgi:pimeloyl-[acyl-carrier protein] methyl ester esterase